MMDDSVSIFITILTLFVVILLDKSKYQWLQKVLEWVPAILFAYIVPAIITHTFHLGLSSVKLHGFSKNFIMPLAIVLVMSALSVKQLKAVGWKPIAVFVSGSFAVAILPILLLLLSNTFTDVFQIEFIGKKYWMGLVTMVGSWVGGSTSQLVLKELVGCPEPIFLIILVLDNLLVNVWTMLMFQFIKRSDSINTFFKIKIKKEDFIPDKILPKGSSIGSLVYLVLLCLAMVGLCWFFIESFIVKVMILSLAGLVFGNVFNWWNHGFVIKIGGYLIIMIMAILGLKLDFSNFSVSPYIILFAAVWLVLHYVVMILVAYFLKINMAWVAVGSMANVGGISTAPAVTKSYNEEWMPHAILLAILSMVTGTYWGMLTIYLFGYLF